MRYRLTFTVNDKSEEAEYINEQFRDNPNIQLDYIFKRGCDLVKTLGQYSRHRIYNLYDAKILEE